MYGPGRPYFIIPLSIVIGLFVPLPFYFAHKFFPRMHFDAVVVSPPSPPLLLHRLTPPI